MEELSTILRQATNQIDSTYFHLNIDGGDPIYRERVYCYELYHQMRLKWPARTEYYLNGEIDKAAHPILKELNASKVKPDFLIHKPGYMSGNHAIIEVKHQEAPLGGIKKDLKSLSLFRQAVGYERAIYLVYGYDINPEEFAKKITEESKVVNGLAEIELWFHLSDSSEAFHHSTIGKRA
ncbi:hypothetical protein [Photobacterium sanguinicancri]|uniref:hypothetical protein n=1 Tax=Photobacterium sanguinicancri TaxID=875932 RepID=UPI0024811540|nr:hypothetical protein [Photobacterium sanguinicancri]